jgi:hypothetical protein
MSLSALMQPDLAAILCSYLYVDAELVFTALNAHSSRELIERRREVIYLFHSLYQLQAEQAYEEAVENDVRWHVLSTCLPDWPSDSD